MDRSKLDELERYAMLIQKASGKSVRPYYKPFNEDGYVNMLNKYGTKKDSSEHYEFKREAPVSDSTLTEYYEGNGLFAKIIDTPAEEAVKHGFELEDVKDNDIINFYLEALDELDWDETCIQALKWTRLFGGCIAVLLVNDGRRLEEPLDFRSIESIDDIRLYERALVTPDWNSINHYDPHEPFGHRGSRLGLPEWYYVNSKYGNFRVHDSRCLVFQNGVLPENTTSSEYQMWGVPEYLRIHRAIRDAEIAHGSAAKMLDRSIQAVYAMKNLASELATEEGESRVLRRMEVIDLARGLLNSIVIDNEGENYDFRQFQYSGVSQVIDSTCNFLSALTSIPQTILFGRSPAGMNSTGASDLENYYNFVERMQKRMVKKNLRYLLSILFEAGHHTGEVKEIPPIKIQFNSLWSQTEESKAALEIQKQQAQLTKAQIALTYIQAQVLDPTEVRRKLAESEEFDIETMLDDYSPEELEANQPQGGQQGGMTPEDLMGTEETDKPQPEATEMAPSSAPAATKLPQDMSDSEKLALMHNKNDSRFDNETYPDKPSSVGVYVIKDGKLLCGRRGQNDRTNGQLCGPGGTVEPNETVEHAAFRETEEEFGIEPKELIFIGNGKRERGSGYEPYLFICTEYDGEPRCLVDEMADPQFLSMEDVLNEKKIFKPFLNGIDVLAGVISLNTDASDDEEGVWRTTDGGHKIHLNEKGEPDKGNPKVIDKMTGGKYSKVVSFKRPTDEQIKVVKEKLSSFDPFGTLEKAQNQFLEESGKSKEEVFEFDKEIGGYMPKKQYADKIQQIYSQKRDEYIKDALKDTGTFMEKGYYIPQKDIDNTDGEVFERQDFDMNTCSYKLRGAASSNSSDNIPAVDLSDSFIMISEEEAKDRFAETHLKRKQEATFGGVSKNVERIIQTHVNGAVYSSVLRKCEDNASASVLKDAIDRTVSPERNVFRGLSGDFAEKISQLNDGDTFEDKGFQSTSYEKHIAESFSGDKGIVLDIDVPSGYGLGMDIGHISERNESEVLLNAGLTMKVVSKKDNVIKCEVVSDNSHASSKNLTTIAKTVILKKDDVQKLMQNGTISNKQNSRKQAAHIEGTPEYIAESKKRHLSVMTIESSEIDRLVQDGLNGKSRVFCKIDKHGNKQYKMRVEADNVIGKYTSKDGTVSKESNKCTVHLSKNGYHAVPSK